MSERRADWRPDETCLWCGDRRDRHDRLADEWSGCLRKTAWFERAGLLTRAAS